MKNKLTIIGAVLAIAVTNVTAQTNDTDSTKARAIAFAQSMADAGNITLSISPAYAPDVVDKSGKREQWGVGVAATYTFTGELGSHVFTGLRLDYLGGELWAPSISGGLKADVQVFGINFTPFAYTGAVFPLQSLEDQAGSVGAIAGAGLKTDLWKGTVFNYPAVLFAGFGTEKWIMNEDTGFDGVIYRGIVGLKISFK